MGHDVQFAAGGKVVWLVMRKAGTATCGEGTGLSAVWAGEKENHDTGKE